MEWLYSNTSSKLKMYNNAILLCKPNTDSKDSCVFAAFFPEVSGGQCPQLSSFTLYNFQGSNGESVMRLKPDMLSFTCG